MRRVSGILLLACGILAGCSDADPPTAPSANPAPGPHTSLTATDLSDVPSEYRYDPYFVSYGVKSPSDISTVEARMYFRANNARQTLLLKLYFGGQLTDQSPTAVSLFSLPLPPLTTQVLVTRQSIPIDGSCGHTVAAYATHEIWNSYLGGLGKLTEWGRNQRSTSRQASQDKCLVEEIDQPASTVLNGGGGGGGPNDCSECIDEPVDGLQWCKVRYWYDTQTGELVDWYVMYCW